MDRVFFFRKKDNFSKYSNKKLLFFVTTTFGSFIFFSLAGIAIMAAFAPARLLTELDKLPFVSFTQNVSQVLQAATKAKNNTMTGEITFNLPSIFNEDVLIDANASVSGTLTAPNILYGLVAGDNIVIGTGQNPIISASFSGVTSFQGQAGPVQLAGGDGIAISGLTITNDDPGSEQKIFGNVVVGSDTIEAEDNTDSIEFEAGDGITLSADTANKKITISGSTVALTTSGGSGVTSSNSGLEIIGGGLTLLKGCADAQVLKWDDVGQVWQCGTDAGAGGSGIATVKSNNTVVGSSFDTLDFSTDFSVVASPSNEANIAIADDILNFTEFSDSLSLDAATTITNGLTGNLTIDLTSTGDFVIADTGTAFFTFGDDGSLTQAGTGLVTFTGNVDATNGLDVSGANFTVGGANVVITTAGAITATGAIGGSNLSGTNTGDQTITLTGDINGSGTGSFATTIQPDAVALATDTTGSYIATITGGSQINVSGSGGENAGVTISITADSIGDSQLAFDTGQNLTTSSSPTFNGLTVSSITRGTDTITDFTGTGLQVTGGALEATLGTTIDLAAEITGILPLANGGTGQNITGSSITDGQILIGNNSADGFTLATLTGGSGITITNGSGGITISQSGGGSTQWTQSDGLGVLYPNISTLDLLVGGTTTASAKFAVLNVSGGTPTASVSGTSGGAFLTATGNLGTSNRQSITLGGGNSGNVVLSGFTSGIVHTNAAGVLSSSAVSLTADVSGILPVANGGTGVNTFGGTNSLLYTTSTDTLASITTGNNGVLITSAGGLPSISSTLPNAVQDTITRLGTVTNGVWNGTTIGSLYGGTGDDTSSTTGVPYITSGNWQYESQLATSRGGTGVNTFGSTNTLLYTTAADTLASITTANNGVLITSAGGAPSISSTLPNAVQDAITRLGTVTNGVWNGTTIGSLYGGTGANLSGAVQGSVPYFSATGVMSTLGPSLAGYVLSTNGGGQNPTWINPASFGTNYWDDVSGVLVPKNAASHDLLLGSQATATAKFAFTNVSGNTPTASISANNGASSTFLTGAGNLGTTNSQTLTIGGTTTGNLVFDAGTGQIILADNTTLSQNLTIDGPTGITFSTTGGITFAGGTLSDSVDGVDINDALEVSGLITANGGLTVPSGQVTTLASFINNGGLLYTNASGVVAQTAVGSNGECLISGGGGSPTWGSCLGNGGTNWNITGGTIQPKLASTLDLLIGGTTTASAKFAVTNINSGTTTASVSGTTGSISLTATGVLGTTNKQTLTFGNSSTGNIALNGFGAGIVHTNSAGVLSSSAVSLTADVSGILPVANGGTGVNTFGGTNSLLYTTTADTLASITTGNNGVLITSAGGVPSISSTLPNAVQDAITRLGTVTLGVWNGTAIGSLYGGTGDDTSSTTGVPYITSGNWQYESQLATARGGTGADLSAATQGSVPYFSATGVMSALAPSTAGFVLSTNGAGQNPSWVNATTLGTNYWDDLAGVLVPKNAASHDLLLGSQATATAKFAFTNVSGNTPTASISANSGANATFLTGTGNLGTTNKQTLTFGGNSTGNIVVDSGSGLITLADNTTISQDLTVAGGDITGANGESIDIGESTNGSITFAATGGSNNNTLQIDLETNSYPTFTSPASIIGIDADLQFVGDQTLTSTGMLSINADNGIFLSDFTNCAALTTVGTTLTCGAASAYSNWNVTSGTIQPKLASTLDFLIGGTTTASAKFAVTNINSGTPTASVSGTTGGASLTATGVLGTTNKQTLNLGSSSTGNIVIDSGSSLISLVDATTLSSTLAVNGDVTFGDAITDNITFTGRVAQDNDIIPITATGTSDLGASGLEWDNLYVTSITQNGATLNATYAPINANFITVTANGTLTGETGIDSLTTAISTTNTLNVDSASTLNAVTLDANANLILSAGTGKIGIGTTTPLGTLDARANSATLPVASFSGTTNFATLIVDNRGNGDLFTASTGGVSKFTIQNNGTIVTSNYTTAGGIFYGTATGALGLTGAGVSGQILQSNGSGVPSWVSSSSINFWDNNNNAISPKFATVNDFLLGSSATNSALFAIKGIASGTPVATLSASTNGNGLVMTASTATLQSLNNNSLTIGGAGTGNIFLNPRNGSAGGFVAPGADNVTDLGTSSLAFRNIYAGTGITVGGVNVCLQNGTNCPSAGTNYWDDLSGVLVPKNAASHDLLLGSQATTTAKFAFTNVSGNTPTASISANSGANNTFLTGAGNLGTTNSQTLTIGGSATGNIILSGRNGSSTGIYFQGYNCNGANGGALTVDSTGLVQCSADDSSAGAGTLNIKEANSALVSGATDINFLASDFTITAESGVQGGVAIDYGNSGITRRNNAEVIGGQWSFLSDILVGGSSTSSAKFAILNMQGGSNTPVASISAAGGTGLGLSFGADGVLQSLRNGTLTLGGASTGNILFSPLNGNGFSSFTGRVGINSTNPLATLDLRGNLGTIPVASISGNTSVAALSVDNRGNGDLFTASSSGNTRFVIKQNGNVGIGTNLPSYTLDVNGTARAQVIDKGGTVNNVKAYGATGDGVTNDTAAINSAIAAGGTTFFPAGTYIVTGLSLSSGTHLLGVGTGNYANPSSASQRSIIKLQNNANTDVIVIADGISYGSIENIEIDGNKSNQTAGMGINMQDGAVSQEAGWRFVNVEVYDANDIGVYIGTNRQAIYSEMLRILASGQHGIQVNGGDSTFVKTLVGTSTWNNIVIGGYVNRFIGGEAWSAGLSGIAVTGNMITISDFGVDRNQQHGISIQSGANNVTVIGSLFHSNSQSTNNTYSDIDLAQSGGLFTFTGNTFAGLDGGITNKRQYAIDTNGSNVASSIGNVEDTSGTATSFTDTAANLSLVLPTGAFIKSGANTIFGGNGTNTLIRPDSSGGDVQIQNFAGSNNVVFKDNGTVGIGTGSNTVLSTLDLRGVLDTIAAASVSGKSNSFAAMIVDNRGTGDIFTASSSGLARFVIKNNGNIGIGTTSPTATLDVNGTASIASSLTFRNGSATIQSSANNTLTLGGGGTGNIVLGNSALSTCTALETVNGVLTCGTDDLGTGADGASNWTLDSANGVLRPNNSTVDLLIGGISSSSARFHVYGSANLAGTTPVASISGLTGAAALIVDNRGTGDIFTASSGGLNRFVIKQNGNVGIGTALPTATLDVNGNASISSALTFRNAAATIQATANNTLTIGGLGTGNIILSPLNGSGTTTLQGTVALSSLTTGIAHVGTGGVITSSAINLAGGSSEIIGILPIANGGSPFEQTTTGAITQRITTQDFLIGGTATNAATTNYARAAFLNIAGALTPIASLSAGNAGGTFFSADGNIQTTARQSLTFGGGNTGNIVLSGFTQNGGVLYTNGSGVISQVTAGGAGTVLHGGTTPSFSAVSLTADVSGILPIANGGSPFEQTTTGAITQRITTQDFLIGGTATNAATTNYARAAFLNIAGALTPVASLSAGNAGGAFLTAAGNLGTTARQSLTIGGGNSGNIVLGNTALATCTALTTVNGVITCGTASSGSNWTLDSASGVLRPNNSTVDLLIGGVSTSSATFHIFGATTTQGTNPVASISGLTSAAGLIVDNRGNGDLFTASSGGLSRFVIKQNGNVGIGTNLPMAALDVAGSASLSGNLTLYGGARTIETTLKNSLTIGSSTTGNILLGNTGFTTCTALTTVGSILTCGTADGASNWDVANGVITPKLASTLDLLIGGTTSTSARFHAYANNAQTGGTIPSASISGRTSAATLIVDNSNSGLIGDIFAASSSGLNRFVIRQNGNVGIGNALANYKLDVAGDINQSAGSFLLSAGNLIIGGNGSNTILRPASASQQIQFQNFAGTLSNLVINDSGTIGVGTGSNTVLGTLDIRGISDTFAAASVSAKSNSFAALVVNNRGTGDIFTASSGGLTRFVINNNGNVGLGTTLPSEKFEVVGNTKISGNALIANTAATTSASQITTEPAGTDSGHYVAIAIGADGLPVIAHQDANFLLVTKCTTSSCSSGNTTTVDSSGLVGINPSIAIGADGLPIISYYDGTNTSLKVIKCGNASCTSLTATTTLDNSADDGSFSSIGIGKDGLPVIAYHDDTAGTLKVAKCTNASCTTSNLAVVDSTSDAGQALSLTIGTDGLPVIAYYAATTTTLKVVKCGNSYCNTGNTTTTIDASGDNGLSVSIAIGTDGLPVIAYSDDTATNLKVAKCGNTACSTGNRVTTVDNSGNVGNYAAMTIGTDGLPVIVHQVVNPALDVKVTKCGNTACSAGNTSTVVESANSVGWYNAIAIGTDGLPILAYYDNDSDALQVTRCANASCTTAVGSPLIGGSDLGNLNAPWRSLYFNTLNLGRQNARLVLNEAGNFFANNFYSGSTGTVGIGTVNPLAMFDVVGIQGATIPTASFSASTGVAGVVIDNRGSGDIFTASSAGLSRFTVKQNGSLQLATTPYGTCASLSTIAGLLTCSSAASNWDVANGVITPKLASTLDLLIGGTTSTSARFHAYANNVQTGGTIPSASISGRTSAATLIVDNSNSGLIGDIFAASSSGLTRFVINQNGNVGIGTALPTQKLDVAGNATASGSLTIGSVFQVGAPQASTVAYNRLGYATTTHGLDASHDMFISGRLEVDGSLFIDGQLISSGTFGTVGWLQRTLGSLAPTNITDDLLLGSISTASAKFAFTNVGGGTPTASISAQSTNNALSLDAGGNIGTTNRQSLTLGGVATGNIVLSPINNTGRVGINTTAPTATLDVNGNASLSSTLTFRGGAGTILTTQNSPLIFGGAGSGAIVFTPSGAVPTTIDTFGSFTMGLDLNVTRYAGVGTTASSGEQLRIATNDVNTVGISITGFTNQVSNLLTINVSPSNLHTWFDEAANLRIGKTAADLGKLNITGDYGGAALVAFNQVGSADILAASTAGVSKFVIKNDGTASSAAGFTIDGIGTIQSVNKNSLTIGSSTTGNILLGNTGFTTCGALTTVGSILTCSAAASGGGSNWTLDSANGVIRPNNSTVDLLIGGVSSSSARFHVYGSPTNAGTLPVASISANTSAAGLIADNRVGDLFAASSSGLNRFVINNNGNVGIGTTMPSAQLQIVNPNFGGTNSLSMYIGSSGAPRIDSGGSNLLLNFSNGNFVAIGGASGSTGTDSSLQSYGIADFRRNTDSATALRVFGSINGGSQVLLNVSSLLTGPTASIGAVTTGAGLVVDNRGAGDLFAASSSGLNRFVINNNGNVGIGTVLPTALLDIAGTASVSSSLTFRNAAATIQATANNTLTLGGTGTGNIVLAGRGGTSNSVYLQGYDCSGLSNAGKLTVTNTGQIQCANDVSAAGGQNYFQSVNPGTITPYISTVDILFGGVATNSGTTLGSYARAGFLNMAGNTPTATLSAGLAGGMYFTADGNIATTANQSLTIGGLTTGNVLINPQSNDRVGIGTDTPLADLHINGGPGVVAAASVSAQTSFAAFVVNNSGAGDIFAASSAGLNRFVIKQNGNVGIGTDLPSEKLTVAGNLLLEAKPNSTPAQQSAWTKASPTNPGTIGTLPNASTSVASISASAVYNGSLYVGTSGTATGSAEILRYDGGTTWTRVSHTTDVGRIGFTAGTSGIGSVSAMTIYDGRLYAGTSRIGTVGGAEVYRYEGGTTWTKVSSPTAGTICGTAGIDGVASMAVYQGSIYVGTRDSAGAEICRYLGGTGWERINSASGNIGGITLINAVTAMAATNKSLYIGTSQPNAARIMRLAGGQGATTTFTVVNGTSGTFRVSGANVTAVDEITSMTVFNGTVVAGITEPSGANVITINEGIITAANDTFTRLNSATGTMTNGGTTGIDGISSMTVYNGILYAGTYEGGNAEIYRYTGGDQKFIKVSSGTGQIASGGLSGIDGVSMLAPLNGDLYAGTYELGAAEVYKLTDISLDRSYALQFHAAPSLAGGEQAGFPNEASIYYVASASANLGSAAANTGALVFSHGIQTRNGSYDVAEDYPTRDESLQAGDVVAVDPNERGFVKKAETPYDAMLGVYSEKPGFRLTQNDAELNGGKAVPVALVGRVPVKVTNEGGVIKNGDYLTMSSTKGSAMKATKAGHIIGRALEGFDPANGEYGTNLIDCPEGTPTSIICGKVMLYVSQNYYDPDIYLTDTGNISLFEKDDAPTLDGNSLFGVRNGSGQEIKRVGVFSDSVIGNLKAGNIDVQKLTLAGQDVNSRLLGLEQTASQTASLAQTVNQIQTQVTSLSDRIASLEGELALYASGSALFNYSGGFSASSGAELALDKINVNDATIGTLSVLGRTLLSDVGITGKINMGLLEITGLDQDGYAAINTSSGPLKLQSTGFYGVDVLDGKLTIDTQGNLKTVGAITAKKYNVDTTDVLSASVGEATIPAGATSATINTTAVTNNSKIFVTPKTKTALPLSVTSQTGGTSFKVEIETADTQPIKFNWWIVN